MSDTARDDYKTIEPATTEGLEDFFDVEVKDLDQIQARSRTGVDVIQDQVLEVVQGQIQPPGFDALSLFRELQAATFRNGYLESQVATYSEQVKLLPDLQAKAKEADDYKTMMEAKDAQLRELQAQIDDLKRGWWSKFSSWFFKGQ